MAKHFGACRVDIGWQADYALATLDALPPIAATVAGRIPILVDGGVRRGTDIMKARLHGGRQPSFPPLLGGLQRCHARDACPGRESRVGCVPARPRKVRLDEGVVSPLSDGAGTDADLLERPVLYRLAPGGQ